MVANPWTPWVPSHWREWRGFPGRGGGASLFDSETPLQTRPRQFAPGGINFRILVDVGKVAPTQRHFKDSRLTFPDSAASGAEPDPLVKWSGGRSATAVAATESSGSRNGSQAPDPWAHKTFVMSSSMNVDAFPSSRSTRLSGNRPSLWVGPFEVPVLRARGPESGGNRPLAATARISSSRSRIPDRLAVVNQRGEAECPRA